MRLRGWHAGSATVRYDQVHGVCIGQGVWRAGSVKGVLKAVAMACRGLLWWV